MGVLAEYVKKEAEQLRKEVQRSHAVAQEWEAAVNKLYQQLEQWVTEIDAGHDLLYAERVKLNPFQEPRLGVYDVPGLRIGIGTSRAEVVPKSRYSSAVIQPPGREARRADGVVQINQNSLDAYYLFRWTGEAGDEWFIRSLGAWHASVMDNTVDPLDRDSFEAAMLRVLQ